MNFEYSFYQKSFLIWPIAIILITTVIIVVSAVRLIKLLTKKEKSDKKFDPLSIVSLLIPAWFLISNIVVFANGGYCLFNENEEQAIEIVGEIQSIEAVNDMEFPLYKSDYGYGEHNGVKIVVSGQTIKAPGCIENDFSTGERVVVKYLPQSGFVLSINSIN